MSVGWFYRSREGLLVSPLLCFEDDWCELATHWYAQWHSAWEFDAGFWPSLNLVQRLYHVWSGVGAGSSL